MLLHLIVSERTVPGEGDGEDAVDGGSAQLAPALPAVGSRQAEQRVTAAAERQQAAEVDHRRNEVSLETFGECKFVCAPDIT